MYKKVNYKILNHAWYIITAEIFFNLTVILFRNFDDLSFAPVAYNITRNPSQKRNLVSQLPVDAQIRAYVILTVPITHRHPL